ncbi:MAG: citrate lyase acyl carrier protein [Christensenellales bacterium]
MQVQGPAIAGTLESSDVQVTLEPIGEGIQIELSSSVMYQYGRQIRQTILDTLARLSVDGVKVTVVDKGALECTLKARLECAVFRAAGVQTPFPWGGLIT